MTERPPHLPELPEPYARPTDHVPARSSVDVGGPAATISADVLTSPADAADRSSLSPMALAQNEPPAPTGEATLTTEHTEQARVRLTGRLGQNPTIRTTPKGTLVARFPLAVRDEQDVQQTTWHTVLAFKQRAEQVRDSLKKGDAVEVIGYIHTRELPRRDGSTRMVREVYATVVRPVTGR